MPESDYIVIPEVQSKNRDFIPIGYLTPDVICNSLVKLIPDATYYHFGILVSRVHMDWMRVVGGHMKSDYRYSKEIIYNNFPWPNPTPTQKKEDHADWQGNPRRMGCHPGMNSDKMYSRRQIPDDVWQAH